MKSGKKTVNFLIENNLTLVTAESCTAGQIAAILGKIEHCGKCLDIAYVVYSERAKTNVLHVKKKTIASYGLTSEEVAVEMIQGALNNSSANTAIATTGITGKKPLDNVIPGTVCFAWGLKKNQNLIIETHTKIFMGSRAKMQIDSAHFALDKLISFLDKNLQR